MIFSQIMIKDDINVDNNFAEMLTKVKLYINI